MTASIHTLSIKFNGFTGSIQKEVKDCMKSGFFEESGITSSKINVNRLYGDIYKYSEFQTALNTILLDAGVKDYRITRVDVRLDSYDKEHYKRYMKLNRIITSLLGTTYKTQNNYRCVDLFSNKQLSIAVKNDYFQIEHYDKNQQSQGRDRAKSRLELRSLKWNTTEDKLKDKFIAEWEHRLDKSVENYGKMQMRYNDELVQLFKQEMNKYPKRYNNLTGFLLQYQDCIFTKEQMIDLLKRFDEVSNPQNKEKNHRQKYGIDYYSKLDVLEAVEIIKRAVRAYFDS